MVRYVEACQETSNKPPTIQEQNMGQQHAHLEAGKPALSHIKEKHNHETGIALMQPGSCLLISPPTDPLRNSLLF